MRNFSSLANSVIQRLADLIEFSDAAMNAAEATQKKHLNQIIDQEEKMEMRVARALGVEYRALIEGRLELAFVPDAEREVQRRRGERKRLNDQRRREREMDLREMGEGAYA